MARRTPSQINLLIAVDKPVGMSSHDVVSRVRRAVGERRVGHAGTLDPLASGVMVVGIGQATRLLGMITLDRKRYLARIAFGTETVTDDAEGEVSRVSDPARATGDLADEGFARKALSGFLGAQMQVPPAYSAISVGGVRSYRRARSGEDFELPPRPIEVYAADLVAIEAGGTPVWDVSFDVSKGAYIRSLARDLGRACGSAAHLDGLRRTRSGSISLSSCLPLDEVGLETVRPRALDPVGVLGHLPGELDERSLEDVRCGRRVAVSRLRGPMSASDGTEVALTHAGELCAIARIEGSQLVMSHVFPQGIEGVR